MKKIKILNIISDTNIGGAGKCIITYCKNRDIEKFDISVLMPKDSLLKPEIEKTGVKVIEIDGLKDKSLDLGAISKIKKILKEEEPDIVHTHASLSARIAAKQYGKCKIIYTKHCDFPLSNKFKYKIVRKINQILNESLTDKIIATSELAKENLIKQGLNEDLIETVLNGVDGFKEISESEKIKLREKYNLSKDDITVGYLARIEELKGHRYFIEAAKIIKDRKLKKSIKFLIMGSGSYEETAKQMVKDLGLEDTVIFTGFISDVGQILNIIDVQINASYLSETTNLALLEGMSLGIPTVATKCGGTPKMIDDFENGILVEKASSEALADGIELILKDDEKFKKMQETSKKIFNERYTSKVYASNIEKIYESMVSEMKIIQNKKLFGIINLMDIIIAAVILIVGIIAYNVVFKSEVSSGIGAKYFTTTCTLRFEGMPVGASEYLNVGADVYDNETNTYIGKLVNITSGDYIALRINRENDTYVETVFPGRENVYLTLEVNVSDQGTDLITENNYFIKVGKAISIRSSNFAGGGYITTIDREAK